MPFEKVCIINQRCKSRAEHRPYPQVTLSPRGVLSFNSFFCDRYKLLEKRAVQVYIDVEKRAIRMYFRACIDVSEIEMDEIFTSLNKRSYSGSANSEKRNRHDGKHYISIPLLKTLRYYGMNAPQKNWSTPFTFQDDTFECKLHPQEIDAEPHENNFRVRPRQGSL